LSIVIHFDVALSCNLKNEDVTQCLKFILEGKKTVYLISIQLMLLKIEKNSPITDKSIEKHFEREFDCYFSLLQNDPFWSDNVIFGKLVLAQVLKQSTNWKRENWEDAAFQEYIDRFSRNAFSSLDYLNDQDSLDAKKNWINCELGPRIIEFQLWQKLRESEKIPEFIFEQIFSQNHLKILEDYIQNQSDLEENLDALLFCHEHLRLALEQWMEKLNQNLKKYPLYVREEKLAEILIQLMII